jgi:hypothetical protein
MKKILSGLLLSTLLGTAAPQAITPGPTFYVVALAGADLHAKPSLPRQSCVAYRWVVSCKRSK